MWELLNWLVSFALITLLFALIYKMLPDVEIAWNDVWVGAAATAVLFTVGKTLLGLYLGKSSVTSAFGAAGSLVLILLWVYYSAQLLLFGAEFTRVWAIRHGSHFQPSANAMFTTSEDEARRAAPPPCSPQVAAR
jgi:membrane protein